MQFDDWSNDFAIFEVKMDGVLIGGDRDLIARTAAFDGNAVAIYFEAVRRWVQLFRKCEDDRLVFDY